MRNINNINRRKFLEIFGCCSCGLLITSCTNTPITERKQLRLLPESSLNRQAAQLYARVKSKSKLSKDKKQLNYIDDIYMMVSKKSYILDNKKHNLLHIRMI